MQNAIYDASEVVVDIAGNSIKMVANKLKTIKLYEGGEKVISGWLTIKTTILESSIKMEMQHIQEILCIYQNLSKENR